MGGWVLLDIRRLDVGFRVFSSRMKNPLHASLSFVAVALHARHCFVRARVEWSAVAVVFVSLRLEWNGLPCSINVRFWRCFEFIASTRSLVRNLFRSHFGSSYYAQAETSYLLNRRSEEARYF